MKGVDVKMKKEQVCGMTKKRMSQYKSLKDEIKELEQKLKHMGEDDNMYCSDTILDYRSGKGVAKGITGIDWTMLHKTEERYMKLKETLQKECNEIELYINDIEDSRVRRILRLRFIDGKSQMEIGLSMHLDQSMVSKTISKHFASGI